MLKKIELFAFNLQRQTKKLTKTLKHKISFYFDLAVLKLLILILLDACVTFLALFTSVAAFEKIEALIASIVVTFYCCCVCGTGS